MICNTYNETGITQHQMDFPFRILCFKRRNGFISGKEEGRAAGIQVALEKFKELGTA